LLLVVALAGVLGYSSWRASQRQQIIRVVEAMRRSAEKKEMDRLMSYVSPGYRDAMGFGRAELERFGEIVARGPEKLRLKTKLTKVEARGGSGVAQVETTLWVDKEGPFSADLLLEFRKERGAWMLSSSAGWQQFVASAPAGRPRGAI